MSPAKDHPKKKRMRYLALLCGFFVLVCFLIPALSGCVIHANQHAHKHGPHTATHSHHHCHEKIKKGKRGKHKHKKRCHTHRHHDGHH